MIVFISIVLGVIVFAFTFIASKRSGKYYMAPIVTFFVAGVITLYGLFFVGGFEGMAYGIFGLGLLVTAIVGTIILPIILRKGVVKKEYSRTDKWNLFLLPLLAIIIVGSLIYFNENYWVIEEGTLPKSENKVQGYMVSTISEGSKMLHIRLGEKYVGKSIEVKKVKQLGSTTVILEIKEGGKPNELPYIKIGLDKINDPLLVETTDGAVIGPFGKE